MKKRMSRLQKIQKFTEFIISVPLRGFGVLNDALTKTGKYVDIDGTKIDIKKDGVYIRFNKEF